MMQDRLTEQIIRNNITRNLAAYLEREPNLELGVDEYFETWGDAGFHWIEAGTLVLHPNSALNDEERDVLALLVALLNEAWSETEGLSPDEFLATDWPLRIKSLASQAFVIMAARGRSSEEAIETEPSGHFLQ